MVPPLWKTLQRVLRKPNIDLLYDPAMPLLSTYPNKTVLQKDTCTHGFIAASWTRFVRFMLNCFIFTSACKCILFYFFFFVFFRAAPMAYGGSQAKDLIRALAAAYTTGTATQDPSHICDLHHSSRQCRILNPLSKARARTGVLIDTSRVC